jgi:NAD(P)-dependent dehydrogenase (short-subunit alcohol dehydrogenase family)
MRLLVALQKILVNVIAPGGIKTDLDYRGMQGIISGW